MDKLKNDKKRRKPLRNEDIAAFRIAEQSGLHSQFDMLGSYTGVPGGPLWTSTDPTEVLDQDMEASEQDMEAPDQDADDL